MQATPEIVRAQEWVGRARAVGLIQYAHSQALYDTSPWTAVTALRTSASRLPECTAPMSRKKSYTEDFIMRLQRVVIRSGIDSNFTVSQPQRLGLGGGV